MFPLDIKISLCQILYLYLECRCVDEKTYSIIIKMSLERLHQVFSKSSEHLVKLKGINVYLIFAINSSKK